MGGDLLFVLERQGDVVEAVQETMATKLVDVEGEREAVVVGDRVLVRPGERIPIDGTVRGGNAAVDQSSIEYSAVKRTTSHCTTNE